MSSFKKLKSSDVSLIPYTANKQWDLNFCSYPSDDSYITIYKGTNLTSSFNPDTEPVTENQYERLVYDSINHLFYQSYSGSLLNTSSLANSLFYESASENRPIKSYFNYNEDSMLVKNFPSGSNNGIRVLAVNQNIFGSQVLPYNFQLSSSAYLIMDDGRGNLYEESTHVGNIFYSHGLAIITNQDYQDMFPLPPLAFNDYYTFIVSDVSKNFTPLSNDIVRSGTLVTSSIVLSGSQSSYFAVNSLGTGSITTNVAGIYDVYYTVEADLNNECNNLVSNKARIRVNIVEDEIIPTTTTTTTTTTTSTTTTSTTLPPLGNPSLTYNNISNYNGFNLVGGISGSTFDYGFTHGVNAERSRVIIKTTRNNDILFDEIINSNTSSINIFSNLLDNIGINDVSIQSYANGTTPQTSSLVTSGINIPLSYRKGVKTLSITQTGSLVNLPTGSSYSVYAQVGFFLPGTGLATTYDSFNLEDYINTSNIEFTLNSNFISGWNGNVDLSIALLNSNPFPTSLVYNLYKENTLIFTSTGSTSFNDPGTEGLYKLLVGDDITLLFEPNKAYKHEFVADESTTTTTTTTTTSTTTSTTTTPSFSYDILTNSAIDRATSCTDFSTEPTSLVYASTNTDLSVTSFYTDALLTTLFLGDGGYYSFANATTFTTLNNVRINSSGVFTSTIEVC